VTFVFTRLVTTYSTADLVYLAQPALCIQIEGSYQLYFLSQTVVVGPMQVQ